MGKSGDLFHERDTRECHQNAEACSTYARNLAPRHKDEDREGYLIMSPSKGNMYNVDPNDSQWKETIDWV